jgi:hypothetical protein
MIVGPAIPHRGEQIVDRRVPAMLIVNVDRPEEVEIFLSKGRTHAYQSSGGPNWFNSLRPARMPVLAARSGSALVRQQDRSGWRTLESGLMVHGLNGRGLS